MGADILKPSMILSVLDRRNFSIFVANILLVVKRASLIWCTALKNEKNKETKKQKPGSSEETIRMMIVRRKK